MTVLTSLQLNYVCVAEELRPHRKDYAGRLVTEVWNSIGMTENPFVPHSVSWSIYDQLIQNHSAEALTSSGWANLPDIPPATTTLKRRLPQPVFKLPYETINDIRLRLLNGLVYIGPSLYHVDEIRQYNHDGQSDYLLKVTNADGTRYKASYNSHAIDLRSPEPQYYAEQNFPVYLLRPPYRQQHQALQLSNTVVKPVGRHSWQKPRNLASMMRGLTDECLSWAPNYADLMLKAKAFNAIRLSKDVSFFVHRDKLLAEYKGRPLGKVYDNEIHVDENDRSKPWIKHDVETVGCVLK